MNATRRIAWDEAWGERVRQSVMAHLARLNAAAMGDAACVNAMADHLATLKSRGALSSFLDCKMGEAAIPIVQATVCWNRGFQCEVIFIPKGCLTPELADVFEVMDS